jgi:hypothetical protein
MLAVVNLRNSSNTIFTKTIGGKTMDKSKLQAMLKMWEEVMEDEDGFRVIDFVEVHGNDLEFLLGQLAS